MRSLWPYPVLLFGIAVWPGGVVGLGAALLAIVVFGVVGAVALGLYRGMKTVVNYYGGWAGTFRYMRGQ